MDRLQILLVGVIGFGMISTSAYAQDITLSPLKQIQAGVTPQDVKCNQGLVLIIRPENGSPACVSPTSATRLLSYGWVTPDKFIHLNQTSQTAIANNENTTPISSSNGTANVTHVSNNTANLTTQTKNAIPAGMLFNGTNNGTSNATNTGGNGTLTPAEIYKLYGISSANGLAPQIAGASYVHLLPMAPVNYTVTSNRPGTIKILMIGISPYPLKVGDMPVFTMTWQNVSDKPLYQGSGDGDSPLDVTILPSDSATGSFLSCKNVPCDEDYHSPINPGQIDTNPAYFDPTPYIISPSAHNVYFTPGYYHVIKSGTLQVTLHLYLDGEGSDTTRENVQFNLTATQ
ncbi:MAG: hypothetical protein WBF38_05615 [Nitrosotalea sp.]